MRTGVAPVTPGPDGQPFDWTQVTAGHFVRPLAEAPAAQSPRSPSSIGVTGSYISQHDVNSRAVLAILEILFALQESDGKHAGPMLTLPVGG